MKKLILIILILICSKTFAGEGMVVVLEAALFEKPSINSKVLQLKRKGELIYIHDKHLAESPFEVNYYERKPDPLEEKGFLQTVTRNGVTAFVLKKYIKINYRDSRELKSGVTRFKHDPTDYRLEEPLPDGYPLSDGKKRRAYALFTVGSDFKNSYPYAGIITEENYSKRMGAELAYLWKVNWDKYDRFYVGNTVYLNTAQVKLKFLNGNAASETRGQIGAGPTLSYDIYKSESYRIMTTTSLTINFNRFIVSQAAEDQSSEERIFKGFSITPKFAALIQKRNFFPNTDLTFGTALQLFMPHSLKSSTPSTIDNFWEDEDKIKIPFGANVSFFIGIHSLY